MCIYNNYYGLCTKIKFKHSCVSPFSTCKHVLSGRMRKASRELISAKEEKSGNKGNESILTTNNQPGKTVSDYKEENCYSETPSTIVPGQNVIATGKHGAECNRTCHHRPSSPVIVNDHSTANAPYSTLDQTKVHNTPYKTIR